MDTDARIKEQYDRRQESAPRKLLMSPMQSALLYNLLSDNARAWNAPLRAQLMQVVSRTEAGNAAVALREGTENAG